MLLNIKDWNFSKFAIFFTFPEMSRVQRPIAWRNHDAGVRLSHVWRVRARRSDRLRRQRVPVVRRGRQLAGRTHSVETNQGQGS